MGLDMYLNARRYLWSYPEENEDAQKTKAISAMFPELADFASDRSNGVKNVTAEIGYWRKANAIHKWFVDNVQDGVDNCGDYYVEYEKLEELLGVVNKVLADTSKAHELLPTASGFFFGNTQYDEWYWHDIEYTKELLEKLLKNKEDLKKWDLYYHASW